MFYVEVEKDINIFVEDLNPSGEKTIVFIHGWPVDSRLFRSQFIKLSRHRFRCIKIDLSEFRERDNPIEGYSYNRLAYNLYTVMQSLSLKNITLVGVSRDGTTIIKHPTFDSNYRVTELTLFLRSLME